ncbi:hypothetical protein C8F01DRAFT_1103315 [Mycena amicta]|nr:hypothetical protein C8F01DRAFT_1103315 [Mycena amicta]
MSVSDSDSFLFSDAHSNLLGADLSISELSLSEGPRKESGKRREEKLRDDVFVLRKLNAALSSFNDALGDVGSQNERIAAQLEQTEGLLNNYVDILSESEQFAQLILDEDWHGADADELIIMQEQEEEANRARKLAEERVAVAQREKERREKEERDRMEMVEKERKERGTGVGRGVVRGVRGTRGSIRAATRARGVAGARGRG